MAIQQGLRLMLPQTPTTTIGWLCVGGGLLGSILTNSYRLLADIPNPTLPVVDISPGSPFLVTVLVQIIGFGTVLANGWFTRRNDKAEAQRKIDDSEARAARMVADSEAKAARITADSDAKVARMAGEIEDLGIRRKVEREFMNGQNLEQQKRINELQDALAILIPHVDRNDTKLKELAEHPGINVLFTPKVELIPAADAHIVPVADHAPGSGGPSHG